MNRYECDKCDTTMEDIERVNFAKFGKCPLCKKFAADCWRFAVACAGEQAENLLIDGLMASSQREQK